MHFIGGEKVRRKLPPNPQPCRASRLIGRVKAFVDHNKWLPKYFPRED